MKKIRVPKPHKPKMPKSFKPEKTAEGVMGPFGGRQKKPRGFGMSY